MSEPTCAYCSGEIAADVVCENRFCSLYCLTQSKQRGARVSEFILVKNADDSGHLLLRTETIEGVRDYTAKEKDSGYSGNSRIRFWTEEGSDWYESASTASEVLAAIQEAQGVVPRHVEGTLAVDMGKGQDESRFGVWHNNDTIGPRLRNTILAGPITERFVTSAERAVFVCTCPHHQGDNPACPVHGKGTAWGDLYGE